MRYHATARPVHEPPPGTYICARCGIQRQHGRRDTPTHCRDCEWQARWAALDEQLDDEEDVA